MSKQRSTRVSLCMIVRNEAQNLEACLAPVADLFDEIVIIDTGSQDVTKEIARRYTSKVFDFPWCDDFSAARNESLKHASGEWIFWLDADDRLDEANVKRLSELLDRLDDRPAAFMMNTVCVASDPCETPRLITHARLFRKHPELGFVGRVHEQLEPAPAALGYEIYFSEVQVQHVGYSDSARVQRKLQRDIRLLRMDYAVHPSEPRTLLHLGTTYAQLGKTAEAQKFLEELLANASEVHDYLRRVYSALGDLYLASGQPRRAVEILEQGRVLFPDDDYLAFLESEALYEMDEYEAAKALLLDIIDGDDTPRFRAGAPSDIKRQVAPRSLGEVLRIQRQFAAAESALMSVLKLYPQDVIAWHALGRVYIDARSQTGLEAVCQQLAECPKGELFSSMLKAAWHMVHAEWRSAEKLLDPLIGMAPQMPLLRLMRAEVLTRRGAGLAACLQAYRDVLRVHPGNLIAAEAVRRLEGQLHRPTTVGSLDLCSTVMAGAGSPA